MELEFKRNKERFAFLKWGSTAFQNMLVVPPGSGIVHQVWDDAVYVSVGLAECFNRLCGTLSVIRVLACLICLVDYWIFKGYLNLIMLSNDSVMIYCSDLTLQVNLEYLGRVVFNSGGFLYPDSVVGTDSHTTMIDGLGVAGWGVGGIEAEAAMLGQVSSFSLNTFRVYFWFM